MGGGGFNRTFVPPSSPLLPRKKVRPRPVGGGAGPRRAAAAAGVARGRPQAPLPRAGANTMSTCSAI